MDKPILKDPDEFPDDDVLRRALGRTKRSWDAFTDYLRKDHPETTAEWRYYNAIYFPYVAGLKPSRRSQTKENLADYEIQALEWFHREVPERTLYNWQNKAAELIALDLREKIQG